MKRTPSHEQAWLACPRGGAGQAVPRILVAQGVRRRECCKPLACAGSCCSEHRGDFQPLTGAVVRGELRPMWTPHPGEARVLS